MDRALNRNSSPVSICHVGLEAEAEFKAIAAKIYQGKQKLRSLTCDHPILCWVAPNKKKIMCPVHGASMDVKKYVAREFCMDEVWKDMTYKVTDEDIRKYRDRLPELQRSHNGFLNWPPLNWPLGRVLSYSVMFKPETADDTVDCIQVKWEQIPRSMESHVSMFGHVSISTKQETWDLLLSSNELTALDRRPNKNTKMNEKRKCVDCHRTIRKAGFSSNQWRKYDLSIYESMQGTKEYTVSMCMACVYGGPRGTNRDLYMYQFTSP